MILQKMAHLATWPFSDLAFSKLLLDKLTGSQICALRHLANEIGALSMQGPRVPCAPVAEGKGGAGLRKVQMLPSHICGHQSKASLQPASLSSFSPLPFLMRGQMGKMGVKGQGQVCGLSDEWGEQLQVLFVVPSHP